MQYCRSIYLPFYFPSLSQSKTGFLRLLAIGKERRGGEEGSFYEGESREKKGEKRSQAKWRKEEEGGENRLGGKYEGTCWLWDQWMGGKRKIGKVLGFHSISLLFLPFGWFLGKYCVVHSSPPPLYFEASWKMPRAIVRFEGFLQDMSLICRGSRQLHIAQLRHFWAFSTLFALKTKLQKQTLTFSLDFTVSLFSQIANYFSFFLPLFQPFLIKLLFPPPFSFPLPPTLPKRNKKGGG